MNKKIRYALICIYLISTSYSNVFRTFILYELLTSIMLSICTYIFYKIFSNSITVIRQAGVKKYFQ